MLKGSHSGAERTNCIIAAYATGEIVDLENTLVSN